MVTKDLWPEDLGRDDAQEVPPVTILREQAAALGARTNNILEGDVETSVDPDLGPRKRVALDRIMSGALEREAQRLFTTEAAPEPPPEPPPAAANGAGDYIVHRFAIRAPALGDYRYVLLRAYQRVTQFYPLVVEHEGRMIRAASPEAFTEQLRKIFSASSTRQVIATLKAQAAT